MTDQPDLNPQKVQQLLADAWNGLDPADRAERIAYDNAHGISGTTMYPRGKAIEFVRGGRTLAMVDCDLLTGDEPLPPGEFVPDDVDTEIEKLTKDDEE
jgi:hypothetical protein